MSRAALLLAVPLMIACSKTDAPPADTSGAMASSDTPMALAMNTAGKWTVRVMPEGRDTLLLTYTMDATNDQNGWKVTLPGRAPQDVRVLSMDPDSIVIENGPYESALRKGIMVNTHANVRIDGNKLTGRSIARYTTTGADTLRVHRLDGERQ